jgi:hypothetical protein
MNTKRIIGVIGILLVILAVISHVPKQDTPITQPENHYYVGGYVTVSINGKQAYTGPMNSFTENIAVILYALITNTQTPTVTDLNGTTRTINMSNYVIDADKFYLPLVRYDTFAGVIDVSYHGYPGAKLWAKSSTLNQNVTTGITITDPNYLFSNSTHEWFWVNVSFTASASSTEPLTLIYARLMHDKDGKPIYVPMLVDTISLNIASGDAVAINYLIYVKNPGNGGGSRTFTYFVYEMLNPNPAYYLASNGVYNLQDGNMYGVYLHQWSGSLPQSNFVVDTGNKPKTSVTTHSWTYNRVSATYVLNGNPQYEGSFQAVREGKTVTIKAIYTSVSGLTVTGSALKVYGLVWYALFSLRSTVNVPSDKALLVQVTVTFG